jgi:integrase
LNRPRKAARHLPPCVYLKHGAYYLVKRGKWERLGADLPTALAEYARKMDASTKGGMDDLIDAAYVHHASKKLSASTKAQYRLAADKLKGYLREFEPGQVKAKHVALLQDKLSSTPNMANRVLTFLRIVFAYALPRPYGVEDNPCAGIKRLPESKRTRLITDAEWRAIHSHAGPRLKVIMELQHLTGQRIGDCLKIRRSQIGRDGIEFKQQKTDAKLLVRWTPELRATVKAAEALSAGKPPALTLLRGRYNGAPDYRSVLLQWNEACAAAGIEDARPNDGRARAATAAKRQGKNAQALLGHTSPTMTERYIRDRETPEVDAPSIRQGLDVGRKRKRNQ